VCECPTRTMYNIYNSNLQFSFAKNNTDNTENNLLTTIIMNNYYLPLNTLYVYKEYVMQNLFIF